MSLFCIIIMLVENSFHFELRLYTYYTKRNTFYMKRNEAKKNKSNNLKKIIRIRIGKLQYYFCNIGKINNWIALISFRILGAPIKFLLTLNKL